MIGQDIDQHQFVRAIIVGNLIQPGAGFSQAAAAQGMGTEQARSLLSNLVDAQATVLAITQLFQIAAVAFAIAAFAIWMVPKAKRVASTQGAH